jgi:hypothetical protein
MDILVETFGILLKDRLRLNNPFLNFVIVRREATTIFVMCGVSGCKMEI